MFRLTRDECQAAIDRTHRAASDLAAATDFTVADRLEELAAAQPEAAFLIHQGRKISYGEANARADEFACIARTHGVAKGDAVAIMMENRPEFLFAWFGVLKLGACTALISAETKGNALAHAVHAVDARFAFVGAECLRNFASGAAAIATVSIVQVPDSAIETPLDIRNLAVTDFRDATRAAATVQYSASLRAGLKNSDPACYIFTSGTTGLPKAAIITHVKWLATGRRWLAMTDLQGGDVFYCVLPLHHGAALMSLLSAVLAAGACCVLRRKFSASNFWKEVATHRVTVFCYVGEICRYLVGTTPVPEENGHSLRIMLGAGMGVDVWRQFTARFGEHIRIYEGLGATESNCGLTNLENVPGCCGRIPYWDRTHMRLAKYDVERDCHVRGVDGFVVPAAPNEPGELLGQIHSGGGRLVAHFDGYTDRDATEKKILRNLFETGDAWFRSGDLLSCDADGYCYFVDRIGDTFRWKSENVSTTDVVQQLSVYTDAELINVYGVQVPDHEGRAGMAAVVMAEGKSFDPWHFYAIAVEKLPHYAVPLFVRIVKVMDLTSSFKLRKLGLQEEGYDPVRCGGDLYVLDHGSKAYSQYSAARLAALGVAPCGPSA
jgi:fatty-acyl-CoA synthase